jgi:hypothetical protein
VASPAGAGSAIAGTDSDPNMLVESLSAGRINPQPVSERNGVRTERLTAEVDDEFVVFLIEMRINSYWKVHKWLPVALAMPRMLRELEAEPRSGLLNHETVANMRTVVTIQYWDSFESLRAYARDVEKEHMSAWASYNELTAETGDVGIFHETYAVEPDDCKTVYNSMPAFGLGEVGRLRRAEGSLETAGGRLGAVADDELPVAEDGRPPGGG